MTFADAVLSVVRQYATFTGRARRAEFWWFYLFTILVGLVAGFVDGILGASFDFAGGTREPVGFVTSLALLLPFLAVLVRRLHDTGRTGWWAAAPAGLGLVGVSFQALTAAFDGGAVSALAFGFLIASFVAAVAVLVFTLLDSEEGPNGYGQSPKYPSGYSSATTSHST